MSAALAFDPRPASERGLSLSLRQHWGASPSGGMDALLGRETLAELAAPDDGLQAGARDGFEAASRLEGEAGFGLLAFDGRFIGTPNIGFGLSNDGVRDYRIGWRLTPAWANAPGFEVSLEATQRSTAGTPAEHGVMLGTGFQW